MGALQMSGYLKIAAEDSAASTFKALEEAMKDFAELLEEIADSSFKAVLFNWVIWLNIYKLCEDLMQPPLETAACTWKWHNNEVYVRESYNKCYSWCNCSREIGGRCIMLLFG